MKVLRITQDWYTKLYDIFCTQVLNVLHFYFPGQTIKNTIYLSVCY